ncbi:MAG: ABC transporter substrate-binding protein [Desulfitobacteriaceae bacterium]
MRKKSALWALIIALVLGLISGCGANTTAPASTATSTPAGDIKIGGDLELTGGVATFGTSVKKAVDMAFEDQNKKGGVLGRQLKFVVADNKSEAGESTAAITKLITQDNVVAVIGAVTSGNTMAASQVAADNKIPLITPTGTAVEVTVDSHGKLKPWIFRSCFLDPFQGLVAATFAVNDLKAKTAALYVDQKDPYSIGLADGFKKAFTAKGGVITASESYFGGDKDFKPVLTNIKAKNPDIVFVPGYYNEVGLIVNQGRGLGMTMPFLGGDGWDSAKLAEVGGAANLNNTYFVNHMWGEDPVTKVFVEAYKAKYGSEPDALAALGYDAAKMMIAAIEKAGSTDGEKIRVALEGIKNLQGVTGTITIDPATHNPTKSAVILKMVDGKKTLVTHVTP